MLMISQHIGIR